MISNILRDAGVIVVVLPLMIFVHELGHFLAAKSFGVRVMTWTQTPRRCGQSVRAGDFDFTDTLRRPLRIS